MVRAVPTAPRPEGLTGRREASALGGKSNTLQKLDFAKLLKLVSRLCKNLHFCESGAERSGVLRHSRAAAHQSAERGAAKACPIGLTVRTERPCGGCPKGAEAGRSSFT